MSDVILHHYALSPFSEKVRRVLAYKQIPWRAVEQPIMAPKPDLRPLTAGYRRVPVMQIGADVYCDTAVIQNETQVFAQGDVIIQQGDSLSVFADSATYDGNLRLADCMTLCIQPSQ